MSPTETSDTAVHPESQSQGTSVLDMNRQIELQQARVAGAISRSIVRHGLQIADECKARTIFVYVDALTEAAPNWADQAGRRVIFVTKTAAQDQEQQRLGHHVIRVPDFPLTRTGQIKIAVMLALYRRLIAEDDVIVFLSGVAESNSLDTVSVIQVGREFEMFVVPHDEQSPGTPIRPEVLERVIEIAVELGSEGREGKPVGALFVVGDTDRVRSLSRQIILNPFVGYPPDQRNLLDSRLKDTIKELATVDGAFLIREDGTVESAGTYLKVGGANLGDLPAGLGARHHAAAAITDVSNALSVVVSQSTGTVTLFGKGTILAQIEKSRGRTPSRV